LKDGHTVPVVSSMFSGACIYCIFWTFGCLNSNLNYGCIKYTSNSLEENIRRSETLETMHVILGRTVHLGTLSAHCRLDLHLRGCQRWPIFFHKMAKTWHGLMICDVAHKNIESLAYQGFGSWVLHNQVIPKAWVTCMPYYLTQMDRWGWSKQEAHNKLSNLGLSQITKQPVAKRWSNDSHWAR
jgi:hypothetical protein